MNQKYVFLILLLILFGLVLGRTGTKLFKVNHENQEHQVLVTQIEPVSLTQKEIILLQRALRHAGYYEGQVRGVINSATVRALRKFQRDHDLEVTGDPDKLTLMNLGILNFENLSPDSDAPSHSKKAIIDQ